MRDINIILLVAGAVLLGAPDTLGQTKVAVNLNMEHSVNGVSEFDRSKFMVLHAGINDNEWDSDPQRKGLLEDLDVYLGRNNGGIIWEFNQVREDPAKPGWPDLAHMKEKGAQSKNGYANKTQAFEFENRVGNMVIGGQPTPMYPNGQLTRPNACCSDASPWAYENYDAVAEYYANYLKEYFGEGGASGMKRPAYLEVLNEPFVHARQLNTTNAQISEMHNVVAKRVKEINPAIKVGGYTAAHPAFESNSFAHWNGTWKLFIDTAGENMDFFSFHLYDFRRNENGPEAQRKGSNIEAIMDMIDHYSVLKLGERKPWYITEYGYLLNEPVYYNKQSDWYQVRSFSSMMMQLMERQDQVIGAIPFMILKARWGTNADGIPYGPRLLRQKKEVPGYEGDGEEWVYTDLVKFFQFWHGLEGTRVDSYADNADLLADAYVSGNTARVVLSNLTNEPKDVDLDIAGMPTAKSTSATVKHLYANKAIEAVLEESDLAGASTVTLGPEATMMITYTFDAPILLTESSEEKKYFADKYLQPINANEAIEAAINGVEKGKFGEAVLRIGVGRAKGMDVRPKVLVNGREIEVPKNWKGDGQENRDSFFGVMEAYVPYGILKKDNKITISFAEGGGHVSSISMQVFNQSVDLGRHDVVLGVGAQDAGLPALLVYPNPASKTLLVSIPNKPTKGVLQIRNFAGQVVAEYPAVDGNKINIEGYTRGLYLLSLRGAKETLHTRFVVE